MRFWGTVKRVGPASIAKENLLRAHIDLDEWRSTLPWFRTTMATTAGVILGLGFARAMFSSVFDDVETRERIKAAEARLVSEPEKAGPARTVAQAKRSSFSVETSSRRI